MVTKWGALTSAGKDGSALRLTVLPLRPGKYQVTSLAEAGSWDEQHGSGPAFGYTGCRSRSLGNRSVEISFEIKEGEVTLLLVPSEDMEFPDLDVVQHALRNRSATGFQTFGAPRRRATRLSWRGSESLATATTCTAIVIARQRSFARRESPFVLDPESELARDEFRGRALAGFRSVRSVHASGFGGACTGGYSFYVYMSDPSELETAIREMGAWLVKEDLQSEIDFSIEGIPVLQ